MVKRKLLFVTNYCGVYTGLGRFCKNALTHIHKHYSDKYEVILAAMGMPHEHPEYARWPWTVYGVLPNDQNEINYLNQDQNRIRLATYGEYKIESIVQKFKPDVILISDDIWAMDFIVKKNFFGKIPVIFHVTIDSLPILKPAIEMAQKNKYFWTWSEFAAKEMRTKYNFPHVKTQYPCLDTSSYFPLGDEQKKQIREKQKIPKDAFIIQFVFRNQLRKLVNKLIEGYSLFKKQNPNIKNTFIHTHTHYGEGWNIPDLCDQYGVNKDEILCTYVCRQSKKYYIMPFKGQDQDNPELGIKGSLITANVGDGVSEKQLNEIYNLADFYCHPATSGSCEMPLVEAALSGLIVATSNYSFGEDVIELNKASIALDHELYTEIGTQFLKSNQKPQSIADAIKKVYEMPTEERKRLGKISRQWALDNYDTKINADKIIKSIDEIPQHTWNFEPEKIDPKNPTALIPDIKDNSEWVIYIYKHILNMTVDANDQGYNHWMNSLNQGMPREQILAYFQKVASEENTKIPQAPSNLENLLDKTDKSRVLLVLKESIGDQVILTSLLPEIQAKYKDSSIYVACDPKYFCIYEGNEYVKKCIPWAQELENELGMVGCGAHKGFFNYFHNVGLTTQRNLNYVFSKYE